MREPVIDISAGLAGQPCVPVAASAVASRSRGGRLLLAAEAWGCG